MKRASVTLLIVLSTALLTGCDRSQRAESMDLQKSLVGTWSTPGGLENPRLTEWGPMLFAFTFMPDGTMTLTLTTISSGGDLDSHADSGTYQVVGQQFVSDLINKGEPVRFEIVGRRLLLYVPDEEPMELLRE